MSDNEQVNVYDDAGNLLGPVSRNQAEAKNLRTENVVIIVFSPDGKIWMQQRALYKAYHPGLWDISVAGGSESHEHPDSAAQRETLEEMGIAPVLRYVESLVRDIPMDGTLLHRYTHFYIAETSEQPIANKEVLAFRAWNINELYKDMEENPHNYLPNIKVLIEKAVETKNPSS